MILTYRTFFIQYLMAITANCCHSFCLISVWGINVCCYRWYSSPVTKVGLVLPPCTFELVFTRFKDYVFLAHLSRRLKWAFLIKICPLSVVVVVVVNFSHFHLLLQNHWANFNQNWHKASLGKGDSSLFKWRTPPFSKGR